MNILFDDEGQLKAASIMSEADASMQVELPGGRRIKVKASNVLLKFASPSASEILARAQPLADEIDVALLWEAAAQDTDSAFAVLAGEYFGGTPSTEQTAAALIALQKSPMYFYKKGKGIYRPAPEASLKAALAGAERKARELAQVEHWVDELIRGVVPEAIASDWARLLYAPDRQSLAYKALAAAADKARVAPVHLLARAGAIASTHELHFTKFLLATFPKGIAFPDATVEPPAELPLAAVRAFSIDDDSTTEIDDAFSVTQSSSGHVIGVHIAAPALGISVGSALDKIARDRLSTVYMPGNKITMLPDAVGDVYSLNEGKTVAAVSLYVSINELGEITDSRSALELVPIANNLRLPMLEDESWLSDGDSSVPFAGELRVLHTFAQKLRTQRGEQTGNRVDYNFTVLGEPNSREATVDIKARARGSAVDTIVSELMILANVSWAQMLAKQSVVAMFRIQGAGKTRMSSQPGAHEGLNVPSYIWATSPLRRYSDLLNQRQIIALIRGETPPYERGNADFLACIADFDVTYSTYADFQQQMEFYWCARYLEQEKTQRVVATVIRENLVRFDHLPIVRRINDLPHQEPGVKVMLAVAEIDLFEPDIHLRFIEKVGL
ncbi:MAG: RNB domain-containing ribonuclease [Betaproteobacteria bacterium]|nr:MAG: RNB domain-containing ribonuclease [Betaproteobacteria bacterium]